MCLKSEIYQGFLCVIFYSGIRGLLRCRSYHNCTEMGTSSVDAFGNSCLVPPSYVSPECHVVKVLCQIQRTGKFSPDAAAQVLHVHNADVLSGAHVSSSNFYSVNTDMALVDHEGGFVHVYSPCVASSVHA